MPSQPVEQWMEAAARCARIAEHHHRLLSKGQASDVTEATFAYAIAAHAPKPEVEKLVEAVKEFEYVARMWDGCEPKPYQVAYKKFETALAAYEKETQ